MRIGVFTALWGKQSFEEALDRAAAHGLSAVEIGTGGLPGNPHCPTDELLESASLRQKYLDAVERRGLIISAFSCHDNPLHPIKEIACKADEDFRKSVRLAELMKVPVVNAFSGCPGASPEDKSINWITCPWPPEFTTGLNYQWNDVAIPYWQEAGPFAVDHGVKVGLEMHPGMMVYNVHTLLRLREAIGPVIGANFDPSHLWWNGVDPVVAIRKLGTASGGSGGDGGAIFHMHGKDVYVDPYNIAVNGCNDNKPYTVIPDRSWTFRSIGWGHDAKVWKDIVSALRMIGYDYVISIEHEDGMMSNDEGLAKGIAALKEALIFEPAGEMFWA
jgi:sugar phosphate isomerase/epimerase